MKVKDKIVKVKDNTVKVKDKIVKVKDKIVKDNIHDDMNEAVSKRSTPATITRVEPSSKDDAGGDGVMVKMQRHLHPRVRYSCHHKKEGVYVLYKLRMLISG